MFPHRRSHRNPSVIPAFRSPHAPTLGQLLAAGSHQLPRWLWGLLRQARLPQFGQHSELSSVLAARAQGQENAGQGYRAGKSDTPGKFALLIYVNEGVLQVLIVQRVESGPGGLGLQCIKPLCNLCENGSPTHDSWADFVHQITTRPSPPRGEYDFQDLCADLLKEEWKCSNVQTFGRRGQTQNGVDILELCGAEHPRAAQCKNTEPLAAITTKEIRGIVDDAKLFTPALSELWIMTSSKKSADAQLEVLEINIKHKQEQLFSVFLKTWDEILLMVANQSAIDEKWFGGGVSTSLKQTLAGISRIEELILTHSSYPSPGFDHTFSRVLLRWNPKFKKTSDSENQMVFTADYSVILLTIEAVIAAGATELAVELDAANIERLVKQSPAALRNRIVPIQTADSTLLMNMILQPVFKEFSAELTRLWTPSEEHHEGSKIARRIGSIALDLSHFLAGMKNHLLVDVDLQKLLGDLETIRRVSKDQQSRLNLATIEGMLKSYKRVTLDSVQLRAMASPRAVELFSDFVQDHVYQAMSVYGGSLGYPRLVAESGQGFSNMARAFVQSSRHKEDVQLGVISVATPTLESGTSHETEEILETAYLPPIISFATAREKASKVYDELGPSPVWPVGSEPEI